MVDASIVVRLLEHRPEDEDLRRRFLHSGVVHGPTLIDAEVSSSIRGLILTSKPRAKISVGRAEEMLTDYRRLKLKRYPMQQLQGRVLELTHNLTAYDSFYVALAETLDMPLLTKDGKYQDSKIHRARVEVWPGR